MTPEEISSLLKNRFGEDVVEIKLDAKDPWARVNPAKIVGIGRFLRDEPTIRLDYLRSLGGVDYDAEFELVYHLFSMKHLHAFVLKTRVPRENPVLPTVEGVWPAANWHEREAFDLLGIRFEGHPDLRRLLLPDDWIGHPLRKDYKEQDQYHGISTTREYQTGMPELPTLKK
jgi:NADH-quinone oxidoreductase subunit C